ncbi:acyltransferase family protein [Lysinibacillus fusiformis]|nr:acyltransferase family protein [Lysinibacillus fusiformis]
MKEQQKEQIVYIDFLRIFAAFAVVLLHTSAPLLVRIAENNTEHFIQGNIINSATRWSVPIFFMISGALLLNSKRDFDLTFFLKKRFSKILIPFLFFSVFYFVMDSPNLDIQHFIVGLANNGIATHLWFFYALIAVYLFAPILIVFVKQSSEKINIYILIVWFILCSIVPFINNMMPLFKINNFGVFGTYLGYFLLGYVLFNRSFKKIERFVIYFLGILGYLMTLLGTHFYSMRADNFFSILYEYNSPNVLIMSIAIFVFFKYAFNFKMKSTKLLTKISALTFGVYLLHPLFLKYVRESSNLNYLYEDRLLITIPFIAIAVFIICVILSYIISIIPILKKVV